MSTQWSHDAELARDAYRRTQQHVHVTQTTLFDSILLKREDLQTTGSFKWRGVQSMISALRSRPRGFVCVSTGNTGVAVAEAARGLKVPAHVFAPVVPGGAKASRITDARAELHVTDESFSRTAERASAFAHANGMLYCSPGASWDFVYGVAGVGIEVLSTHPDVEVIYVPVGGGGLAAGIGIVAQAMGRRVKVVGVQSDRSPYVYDYFHDVPGPTIERETGADCLAGDLEAGAVILEVGRDVLSDVLVVTERELLQTQQKLNEAGINAELGAVAGVSAAMRSGVADAGRTCAVITGHH